MMRQSSSRNQRYKGGFRLRHFFQICLLLAICIWLAYQVKHSHDKKRAFEERKDVGGQPFSFRFGRKDLPSVKENELMSETRNVDEDEVEGREDEDQEQEMKMEDPHDEDGKGDVDDWIDEQDQDQRGEENDQEEEFKNEEENESFAEEVDLVDILEHENSVLDARKENNERDDVSLSVAHETHITEAEAGNANARGLDEEKPDNIDAGLKENSSNVSVAVSNKIDNSSNIGNLNGFFSKLSSIALKEKITLPEAANHSMNGTTSEKNVSVFGVFKHENDSISSPISAEEINLKELQKNTTATLPVVSANPTANVSESLMETANNSTVADSQSYREILGNETASLIPVEDQKHTIQNATSGEIHSKLVDSAVELEHNSKLKTSEEQESEDQFTTTSFSKNEVNLSHSAVTEEEREARTDLSTLPDNQNDVRHDYDETAE